MGQDVFLNSENYLFQMLYYKCKIILATNVLWEYIYFYKQ